MTHQLFPLPSIDPFEGLHVYDGLMMNAERWKKAHNYYRRRQNIHYQSLNQPGIVCGLGVQIIEPPAVAPARFRDRRWIKIQPGIAIDFEGNPIIVDEDTNREFRLATPSPASGTLTVYLVISYVEPENPDRKQSYELLREWFRIDEKTSPATDREIELCRIELPAAPVELEKPTNVLDPKANQPDLRYRIQAQARPQAVVNVAQIKEPPFDKWADKVLLAKSQRLNENLSYLMESVANLYPALQGYPLIGEVSLLLSKKALAAYDLLFITDWQILNLNEEELEIISEYFKTGGIIVVETTTNSKIPLESIFYIIQQQLEIPLQSWKQLSRKHILRTSPFLFAAPPVINQELIGLWHGEGIIVVKGELSAAWGLDDELSMSRSDIRTAQELGINMLHFAWRRRHLNQLQ